MRKFQEAEISIRNSSNSFEIGKAIIRSNLPSDEGQDKIEYKDIVLSNIKQVVWPGSREHIEYLEASDPGLDRLMLLEETDYELYAYLHDQKIFNVTIGHGGYDVFEQSFYWDKDESKSIRGSFRFSGYTGKTRLSLFDEKGRCIAEYPFEIRSRKIGYYDDYRYLLDSLSQSIGSLTPSENSPSFEKMKMRDEESIILLEDFLYLKRLFQDSNLPLAIEAVNKNRHEKLDREKEGIKPGKPVKLSRKDANYLAKAGMDLASKSGQESYAMNHIGSKKPFRTIKRITFDTRENRFVKYFLLQISYMIKELKGHAGGKKEFIIQQLSIFEKKNLLYQTMPWLREVGDQEGLPANSQVLMKKEGYRKLLFLFLQMRRALAIEWDEMKAMAESGQKNLSLLYEYWCFLMLIESIDEFADQVNTENIFDSATRDKSRWSLNLRKGERSKITFKFSGIDCTFYYNKQFSEKKESYSRALRPDYSIIMHSDDGDKIILLDAKYSIKTDFNDTSFSDGGRDNYEHEMEATYQEKDLYKMHTYKDAIRGAVGAFTIYPGTHGRVVFKEGSDCLPSVGAIPLKPSENHMHQKLILKDTIKSMIASVAKSRIPEQTVQEA